MLQVPPNSAEIHHLDRPKVPRGHIRLTGQTLAKKPDINPRQRARWAARWILGDLTLKPTLAMAARVFGVSVPLVIEERDRLLATTVPEPVLNRVWSEASTSEREKFIANHIDELWNL